MYPKSFKNMKALDYLILLIIENYILNILQRVRNWHTYILHHSILLKKHKCQAKLITHW